MYRAFGCVVQRVRHRFLSKPGFRKDRVVNRVAVVTGAGSGMGLAIAHSLADAGHRIIALDLNAEAVDATAKAIRRIGAQAVGIGVDVSDRGAVDAALATARAELGGVGIVVTSAGIAPHDHFQDISQALWEKTLAVNLTGTFNVIQSAMPDMVEQGWGRVVTISSQAGQHGAPQQAHYAASKCGVIALTKGIAWDYGKSGITANSIAPGAIDTPMSRAAQARGDVIGEDALRAFIPVGRLGTVDEIAAACKYLCSEESGFVTGQVLGVNGGTAM